jgi:UDP-hydrolysing UDP-N-acetyl-D-glucosamine 2-epimerase
MRKISFVITARSSYTKYRTILDNLINIKDIKIDIICAGSALIDKFGKVEDEIINDGFKINKKINFILENDEESRPGKELSLALLSFTEYFKEQKPDIVTVMADRYEILAPTIAASLLNIPIAHIQGGELSGNIDEKVRHAVTKLSNFHFPATSKSKKNIIQMGENKKNIFKTGCPSIDIAKKTIKNKSKLSFDIYKKYGGVGSYPNINNGYLVVMQHPVTNEINESGMQINETLKAVSKINMPVIWFWPNVDIGTNEISNKLRIFRENIRSANFHFIKNMNPYDFLEFIYFSNGIIGNSSCAIRECSYLGVPAVNIGTRQVNRERGLNVIDVGYNRKEIYDAILKNMKRNIYKSNIYGNGNAGKKIASVLTKIKLNSSKKFIQYE